jgi:hypothetical protein
MVLCGLVVLGLILGTATATRAMGRPRQHDPVVTTGAPAAAPAPSPITVQFDTYTASITNGATQNDLYIWLAGRAGKVVHVILSVSRPVAVSLTVRPRTLTMASNCRTPNPPGNCDNILGMLGTRYLVYGEGSGSISLVNGVIKIDAYVAVDPVTLDQQGFYTLPLRLVSPNAPPGSED